MDKKDIILCLIRLGNEKNIRMSRNRIMQIILKSNYEEYFKWREGKNTFSVEILQLLEDMEREGIIEPELEEHFGKIYNVNYKLNTEYECSEELREEFEPLVSEYNPIPVEIDDYIIYVIYEVNQRGKNISRYKLQNIFYIADQIHQETYYSRLAPINWYRLKYGPFSPAVHKVLMDLESAGIIVPVKTIQNGKSRIVDYKLKKIPKMLDPRLQHVFNRAIEMIYKKSEKAMEYLSRAENLEWYRRRSR